MDRQYRLQKNLKMYRTLLEKAQPQDPKFSHMNSGPNG